MPKSRLLRNWKITGPDVESACLWLASHKSYPLYQLNYKLRGNEFNFVVDIPSHIVKFLKRANERQVRELIVQYVLSGSNW